MVLSSADTFFKNQFVADFFFSNGLSGISVECQAVWIQIMPDVLLGLVWVQIIGKVISRRQ